MPGPIQSHRSCVLCRAVLCCGTQLGTSGRAIGDHTGPSMLAYGGTLYLAANGVNTSTKTKKDMLKVSARCIASPVRLL